MKDDENGEREEGFERPGRLRLIAGQRKDRDLNRNNESVLKTIAQIQSGDTDPRLLTANQRRMIVAELMRQGMRQIEIADMFGVSYQTITNDKKKILKQLGEALKEFNPQQFVGWVFSEAEFTMARAKRDKNWSLSWGVVQDLTRMLMQLGVLRTVRPGAVAESEDGSVPAGRDPLEVLTDSELHEIERILLRKSG